MAGTEPLQILIYLTALLLVWVPYGLIRRRRSARSVSVLNESRKLGLLEPASLHPRINESECIGCAACITACPEQDVLGFIGGKAQLVRAANCIGHGACQEACPVDAIDARVRHRDARRRHPVLTPDFQTNVPGIFIAGELGGMGLIRNAIEQGRQAIDSIARAGASRARRRARRRDRRRRAGGHSPRLGGKATRAARARRSSRRPLGGAVAHYPRGKIVMTAPVELPLVGKFQMRETSKEALLAFWQRRRTPREAGHPLSGARRGDRARRARLRGRRRPRGRHRARAVLLAIGRRGTPRKLGVPGEELPKVVYRLVDPEQYRGKRVLVVGRRRQRARGRPRARGEQPGTEATLAYRGAPSRAPSRRIASASKRPPPPDACGCCSRPRRPASRPRPCACAAAIARPRSPTTW